MLLKCLNVCVCVSLRFSFLQSMVKIRDFKCLKMCVFIYASHWSLNLIKLDLLTEMRQIRRKPSTLGINVVL